MAKRKKTPTNPTADADSVDDAHVDSDLDSDSDSDADADADADEDEDVELVDGVPGDDEPDVDDDAPELVDEAELSQLVTRDARSRRSTKTGKKSTSTSIARRDPLNLYVSETKRYPLLSREDEHALAVRWVEDGDQDAARKLIEANLRLVVKIAYEYRRAHSNLLDLVQEGNIGLMQAVRKYDPYRGVKLSSYAAWWIRAYILKFILNNWRLVKIGTTQAQRKLFFNLRKEKERLEQLGFTPSTKLLAENLDVSEKDVVEMEKRLAAPDASLDAPVGNDDDGTRTRLDMMESPIMRPDVEVEKSQFQNLLREKLEAFAEHLEGREQTIFRERWLTDEPLTLQQIGDRYGVSRERARQVEKRLMGRLRKHLEQEFGGAVDIDALSRD